MYVSIREIAHIWGISPRRVQVLCAENRIPGTIRIGYSWAVPEDAVRPPDGRIKSGKYCIPKNGGLERDEDAIK